MSTQKPTVGRIVLYKLSAEDAQRIHKAREESPKQVNEYNAPSQFGNYEHEGQELPLIICRVWDNEYEDNAPFSLDGVNGQVFLDGNDTLWVSSAKHGTGPGEWDWPPRV